MKTSTLKTTLIIVMLFISTLSIFSQDAVGMRIDVQGSRYSDQMWVFHDIGTTRGFDNGYDGFKMFGSSTIIPQIFAMEETGNFQIDAVPDLNNTYIAFKAGEDTIYTLTFTSANLDRYYTELYLKDLQTNEIIDIFTSGVTHTFSVKPTLEAVKRFVIISSLPSVDVPADTAITDQPQDTTVNTKPIVLPDLPIDTTLTEQPTDTVVVEIPDDSSITDEKDDICKKDKKDKKEKNSKLKLKVTKRTIVVENESNENGKLQIINTKSGSVVGSYKFPANSTSYFELSYKSGIYLIVATTSNETKTKKTNIK